MSSNASRPQATAVRQRLRASIKRFFNQFRVIRRSLVHPQVPWHAKAVAGCAFLYVISPIQLIPNFIPVIGQMDDVAVVILALKYLRRSVPQSVLDECEKSSAVAVISKIDIAGDSGPPAESRVLTSSAIFHRKTS